jgi:hypothetical protein
MKSDETAQGTQEYDVNVGELQLTAANTKSVLVTEKKIQCEEWMKKNRASAQLIL